MNERLVSRRELYRIGLRLGGVSMASLAATLTLAHKIGQPGKEIDWEKEILIGLFQAKVRKFVDPFLLEIDPKFRDCFWRAGPRHYRLFASEEKLSPQPPGIIRSGLESKIEGFVATSESFSFWYPDNLGNKGPDLFFNRLLKGQRVFSEDLFLKIEPKFFPWSNLWARLKFLNKLLVYKPTGVWRKDPTGTFDINDHGDIGLNIQYLASEEGDIKVFARY